MRMKIGQLAHPKGIQLELTTMVSRGNHVEVDLTGYIISL